MSQGWFCFIYTLNRKSAITSNENQVPTVLLRQHLKGVANNLKISQPKLLKHSVDTWVIIFSNVFHKNWKFSLWYREAYSEPCHTSKMELFAKIVYDWKLLTKTFILDVSQGSEYASDIDVFTIADLQF